MAALSLQVTAKDFRGPAFGGRHAFAGRDGGQDTNRADCAAVRVGGAPADRVRQSGESADVARRGARREVAVRAALGAGRGRLIAQFLTESLVLAGLGAVAGLALALPAMRFLETLVPETMGAVRLTLDWRVLAFSRGRRHRRRIDLRTRARSRGSRLAPQEGLRDGGRGSSRRRAATGSSIRSSSSRRRSPWCC